MSAANPQLPPVSCRRGAPMGRRESTEGARAPARCFRVRFVDGCYDEGGAYWGAPANVYCATNEEGLLLFCRAAGSSRGRPMPEPCVQCGYCCTVRPCAYGEYDRDRAEAHGDYRCVFLTEDNKCAKHDEIVEKEKGSRFPMFGSGCSSSLCNDVREAKLKEKKRCEC